MCESPRFCLDLTSLDFSSYKMIIRSTTPPGSLTRNPTLAERLESWLPSKSWGIHDWNNPRDLKLHFWSFRTKTLSFPKLPRPSRRHILRPSSGSLEKKRKPKADPLGRPDKTKVETRPWWSSTSQKDEWRKPTFFFMVFLWLLVGLVPVLVEDIKSMLS